MRRAAYAGVAIAALLLVSTTGGFTSVGADRGLSIAVADDDEAFVGIDMADQTLDNGNHDEVRLAVLTNRLSSPLTDVAVQVTGTSASQSPKLVPQGNSDVVAPGTLDVSESGEVTADIRCDAAGGGAHAETWDLRIEANGEGVTVDLPRQVTVACTGERAGQDGTPTATESSA